MYGQDKWYRRSLQRLLVDMHVADWNEEFLKDFSAENYAEMMSLAKIDTAEIYAGSCLGLCYWPTQIGFRHKQLRGRDLLGETVAACKKCGIGVQIYVNVWNRAAYDARPEWRIVQLENGKGTGDDSRFGHCCINTGFRQFFLSLVDELNSGYECQGLWIDMIGNYYHCICPECRKKFLAASACSALPGSVNWKDIVWRRYADFQSESLNDFAAEITAVVKRKTPERTVNFQTNSILYESAGGIREKFLNASEYLAGDFTGSRFEQSYICKFYSSLSKNHPIEFMTPRCESLDDHTTERTFENILMRSYASIANQTAFTLIDAIDPRGTLDRRFYEHAGKINESYARYKQYIDGSSRPLFDIGLYHSPDSLVEPDNPGGHFWPGIHRLRLVKSLLNEHHLFHYIHRSSAEQFKDIPMIFLSDCMYLSDAECAALEQYVAEGGKIIATYRTSLYDPAGGVRSDFRLAKLFGIHFARMTDLNATYISPAYDNAIPGITGDYPLFVNSRQVLITADADTEIIGTLTLPLCDFAETRKFSSALSNPPMIITKNPAVVRHKFGKGETLFIAGPVELSELDFHSIVFNHLLDRMLPDKMLETNAPPCVESTLFNQPEQKRLVFSCLNLPAELPVIALHNLEFNIRLPEGITVRRVQSAPEDTDYPFEVKKNVIYLRVPELNRFMMIVIQYF